MTRRPSQPISRRTFVSASAAFTAVASLPRTARAAEEGPVRLGVIGVANRGASNLKGVEAEAIVAICDVDANYLEKVGQQFPKARRYRDYREMIAQEDGLEGVVVSTPDHHHAPAAMRAIERGLAVYCEKPLTHTVAEARALTLAAEAKGVATQMGTQIHAGDNYRRVVEKVRAGAVGTVREVHVWVAKDWGADHFPEPTGGAAPESLAWDAWLGPATERDYTAGLHPNQWRKYRPYGNGTLGDMGCHYMDLPFWALGLRYPREIAAEGPPPHADTNPHGLRVRFRFDADKTHDDVVLTWHDGTMVPDFIGDQKLPGSGVLFVGDEGKMLATYSSHSIEPKNTSRRWREPEPSIPSSIGHHAEWLAAIRGGEPPLCEFGYSGPLTETVLLGTVAHQCGRTLRWNGEAAQVEADDAANRLLSKSYRTGWEVTGATA